MKTLFLASLFVAAGSAACSDRVEIGAGSPTSPMGDAAVGVVGDAAASDAAASDAGTGDTGPATGAVVKAVDLLIVRQDNPVTGTKYEAVTSTNVGVPDPSLCAAQIVGPCRVETAECAPLAGTSRWVDPPTSLSFLGSSFPVSMPLIVESPGTYPYNVSPGPWWSGGGETIGIAVPAGVETPAYSVSLPTPSNATFAIPSNAPAGTALTLGWTITGGTAGEIEFQLNRQNASKIALPYAFCSAPASAGSLVVPAAVIAALGLGTHQVWPRALSRVATKIAGWDAAAMILISPSSVNLTIP